MEEDIKILEKFIAIKINSHAIKFVDISYPEIQQAIAHLIKSYKELEANNYEANNIINDYIEDRCKLIEIRDKAECQDYYTLSDVIDDLNKLLGDDK